MADSLYRCVAKPKSFEDDDFDEDDDLFAVSVAGAKRRRISAGSSRDNRTKPPKTSTIGKTFSLDSDEDEKGNDNNDDDDLIMHVRKEIKPSVPRTTTVGSASVSATTTVLTGVSTNDQLDAAKEMLRKLQQLKSGPSTAGAIVPHPTINSGSAVAADINISLPKIRRAFKQVTEDTNTNALIASLPARAKDAGPQIQVKTRLNGTHNHIWRVSPKETIEVVAFKKKLAAHYNLQDISKIVFKFDGDVLMNNSTLQGADVDGDDMIDVEIPKAFYEGAVLAASKPARPKAITEYDTEDDGSQIKIKTRLNGIHNHNWNVLPSILIETFKKKLAAHYNLQDISKIVFKFDGDVLMNNSTLQDADVDDDNMIDVEIPKAYLDGAITFANEAKENKKNDAVSSSSSSSSGAATLSHTINLKIVATASVTSSGVEEVKEISTRLCVTPHELEVTLMVTNPFDLTSAISYHLISPADVVAITSAPSSTSNSLRLSKAKAVADMDKTLFDLGVRDGSQILIRPASITIYGDMDNLPSSGPGLYSSAALIPIKLYPDQPLSVVITKLAESANLDKDKYRVYHGNTPLSDHSISFDDAEIEDGHTIRFVGV